MFEYLFKIGLRNIWKNKFVFLINTVGFSTSLTVCIILFLWITRQFAYNTFISSEDGVHEVLTNYTVNDKIETASATSYPIIEKINVNIPEVTEITFLQLSSKDHFIEAVNGTFSVTGYQGNSNFFKIIDRPFLFGTPDQCLADPFSVVLSESCAKKIFGDDWITAIEEHEIMFDGWKPMVVQGVFKDFPRTSTIQFDYIFPSMEGITDHIGNYDYKTFVKIGASDKAIVEKKINNLLEQETPARVYLHPFRDTYLYSKFQNGMVAGGRIDYVIIFIVAAVFVLLMALINFVNLYVANSLQRIKELGIRRIIGEERHFQRGQLIFETYVITFVSTLAALLLSYLLLPVTNRLFGSDIDFPFQFFWFWVAVLVLFALTGFIASFYPASVLTAVKPVSVLNGQRSVKPGGFNVRRGFLIFQFFLSVLLIFFSYGVSKQLSYLKNRDLGFKKENVLCYPLSPKLSSKVSLIENELRGQPCFQSISFCSSDLLSGSPMVGGLEWPDKNPSDSSQFGVLFTDNDFLATMDIKIVSGSFTAGEASQYNVPVVVNRIAARKMGGESKIINEPIKVWGTDAVVKGIMEDFHFNTLFNPIQPLIIAVMPSESEYMFVRISAGMEQLAIQKLAAMHSRLDDGSLFSYYWLEDRIENIYQDESRMNSISKTFSILSLFISSLGLFALANFNAEKRVKEFAVRRVLGATSFEVVRLMISEYVILTFISVCISLPVAYYVLESWLTRFAYTGNFFSVSLLGIILMILLVVIVTVMAHAIKATRINPAISLRNE